MGHIDSNFLCTSPVVAPNTASCTTSQLHSRAPLQEMGFVEKKTMAVMNIHQPFLSSVCWKVRRGQHATASFHKAQQWNFRLGSLKITAFNTWAVITSPWSSRFWAKATLSHASICGPFQTTSAPSGFHCISLQPSAKRESGEKNGESGHAARYLIRNPPLESVANSH